MGTISYLNERNISVPDQVSVIGFDNLRMASMYIPKLTTIAQPIYELGYRAAEKVHELVTTGSIDILREKMEHQLIVRESCREK
ncbi:Catabolite control protein A [compost metagenome]